LRRDQKARRARCRRDQKVLFHQRRVWSWDGFLRRVSVEGGGAGVARDARAARGEPATRRADRPGRVARRIRDRRAARSVRIRGVNFPRARVRRGVAGTSALSVRRWVSGARTSAAFDGWILSNSTTRPPLSPVARCSPVLSNSTALIMSASCTSSPGVRSPNTWLKFQSSCPRGSLAAAIVPRPQLSPTLSPPPATLRVAHSSADVAPRRACFFPATGPRRNGTRRR